MDKVVVMHLGDGGYGSVDLVRHPRLGEVAFKTLLSQTNDDTKYIDQFKKEINIQIQLSHPNIANLF